MRDAPHPSCDTRFGYTSVASCMLYHVSCKASEATANRVILRSHYGTKASAHHFRLFQHLHIHPTKPILNVLIRSVKIFRRSIAYTSRRRKKALESRPSVHAHDARPRSRIRVKQLSLLKLIEPN